jgi:hypothetical protein
MTVSSGLLVVHNKSSLVVVITLVRPEIRVKTGLEKQSGVSAVVENGAECA